MPLGGATKKKFNNFSSEKTALEWVKWRKAVKTVKASRLPRREEEEYRIAKP